MAVGEPISLPLLPNDVQDVRSFIENHVRDLIATNYGNAYNVIKYYNTANQQLYVDCVNQIQSGVPAVLLRTRRDNTEEANPAEHADDITTTLEIIYASPVGIEKRIPNVDRYSYVMHYLCRELLRANPIMGIKNNRRRPYILVNNRDVFRDTDIDIIAAEYNINYIIT